MKLQPEINSINELRKAKIAFAVFIFLSIVVVLYNQVYTRSLMKHFIIVNGKVISVEHHAKSSPSATYVYVIAAKTYYSSESLSNFRVIKESALVGKTFPVVVDTTSVSNTRMLFDAAAFKNFGLNYPDSLRWLKAYLE